MTLGIVPGGNDPSWINAVLNMDGLGTVFCGGAIGKGGNKMCVVIGCPVLLHATIKAMVNTAENPTDKEFIFIQLTTKKPLDSSAVYVKPCIPTSRLGSWVARYLGETWSVNAWETLFLHLASMFPSEAEDAKAEDIVMRCENELRFRVIPMKK
jgi:hypothetical protein